MFAHRWGLDTRIVALAGVVSLLGFASSSTRAQECDRACLTGLITLYVDAVAAHDPSTLPLADDVRYTEDSRYAELGEGIWQSVTAKGGFRQDYIDVRKQIAASF